MPARKSRLSERRNKKRKASKTKKKSRAIKLGWVAIPFVLIVAIFLFFVVFRPKYWDGESRVSIAINTASGATVAVFDPSSETITSVLIPKETLVAVSHGLGEWRLGSVWQLAQDEKLGGSPLAGSITKTFLFPTEAWADSQALGFINGNPLELVSATIAPYQTNLNMRDRLSLALFSLNVNSTSRIEYRLEETSFLSEQTLADGDRGYTVSGSAPSRILAIFGEDSISQEKAGVTMVDGSQSSTTAKQIGRVVEVLGAKVVAIKNAQYSGKCRVEGNKEITVKKISQVFDCSYKITKEEGVTFYFGDDLAERF